MPDYKAPVSDIRFVVNEVLESEKVYQKLPGYEEATRDLTNAIIDLRCFLRTDFECVDTHFSSVVCSHGKVVVLVR